MRRAVASNSAVLNKLFLNPKCQGCARVATNAVASAGHFFSKANRISLMMECMISLMLEWPKFRLAAKYRLYNISLILI